MHVKKSPPLMRKGRQCHLIKLHNHGIKRLSKDEKNKSEKAYQDLLNNRKETTSISKKQQLYYIQIKNPVLKKYF